MISTTVTTILNDSRTVAFADGRGTCYALDMGKTKYKLELTSETQIG